MACIPYVAKQVWDDAVAEQEEAREDLTATSNRWLDVVEFLRDEDA